MVDAGSIVPAASRWRSAGIVLICSALSAALVASNIEALTSTYPVKSPQQLRPHLLAAPVTFVLLVVVLRSLALGAMGRWRLWLAAARLDERGFGAAVFTALWILYAVVIASQAPGWFPEDVVYTHHMVRAGWWSGWYSPLHPLLFTVLLQIVPSMWFVTLCNAGLAAFVLALYSREMKLLGMSRAAAATFILAVAILPPTLVMILAPVRDSFFASMLLLFGLMAFRQFRGAEAGQWAVVRLMLLGGVLSAYRLDALPAVALVFFALAWRARSLRVSPRLFVVLSVVSLVAILQLVAAIPRFLGTAWDARAEHEYKLTLIAHPLTYFVREGHFYSRSQENQSAIEKVFPFEILQKFWNPYNIAVFYVGGWKQESTQEERHAAFLAAGRLFADNPGLYLTSKFKLFMRSSGLQDNETYSYSSAAKLRENRIGVPAIPRLLQEPGKRIESMLHASQQYRGLALDGRILWWNVIVPNAILLLALFLWSTAGPLALLSGVLLLRELVVTLLAPASFVHYYFPILVGGYLVAGLAVPLFRYRHGPRKKTGPARR